MYKIRIHNPQKLYSRFIKHYKNLNLHLGRLNSLAANNLRHFMGTHLSLGVQHPEILEVTATICAAAKSLNEKSRLVNLEKEMG